MVTVLATAGLYIIGCFISPLNYALINVPSYTISKFQIWRLVTSPFISFTFLNMIVSLLLYAPEAHTREKKEGTVRVLVDFVIKNLEINLVLAVISLILSFVFSGLATI